jgi:hypothetical protein
MSEKQKTQAFLELLQAVLNEDAKVLSAFLEFEVNGIRLRIDIDEDRPTGFIPPLRDIADQKTAETRAAAQEIASAVRPNFSDVPQSALAAMFNQVADADPTPRHITQEHLPAAAANPECAPATDEEIAAMARASRASGASSPPISVPRR